MSDKTPVCIILTVQSAIAILAVVLLICGIPVGKGMDQCSVFLWGYVLFGTALCSALLLIEGVIIPWLIKRGKY